MNLLHTLHSKSLLLDHFKRNWASTFSHDPLADDRHDLQSERQHLQRRKRIDCSTFVAAHLDSCVLQDQALS
jgi:hypothetical protein